MGELDVIHLPGQGGMWARRCVVEAWIEAGRPPARWAGRTYEEQKYLSDGWKARRPGFNAADDPDLSWTRVPHVRGMALDLRGWSASIVARMEAAGFTRPIWVRNGFSQDEPWHFELARFVGNVRSIPKVTEAQVAAIGSKPFDPAPEPVEEEEEDMTLKGAYYTRDDGKTVYMLFNEASGFCVEHSGVSGSYNNEIAAAWETNSWAKITEAHATVVKRSLAAIRPRDIPNQLAVDLTGTVDFE